MKNKAFTLIELAVVLLVIGILAAIVLRNIGSQAIQSRDAKRVGDLRNVSTYVAQYLSKNGQFPVNTDLTWNGTGVAELGVVLQGAGIVSAGLPVPSAGSAYQYYACSDATGNTAANHFILRAVLEQTAVQNPKIYEGGYNAVGGALPTGWSCMATDATTIIGAAAGGSVDCDQATNRAYCNIQ